MAINHIYLTDHDDDGNIDGQTCVTHLKSCPNPQIWKTWLSVFTGGSTRCCAMLEPGDLR